MTLRISWIGESLSSRSRAAGASVPAARALRWMLSGTRLPFPKRKLFVSGLRWMLPRRRRPPRRPRKTTVTKLGVAVGVVGVRLGLVPTIALRVLA